LPVASVPTFAAGEELPASKLSFLVNKPAAQLYAAIVQSIPNSAFTALTFDAERFDVFPSDGAKGHSTSVNPSRYTVVTPGVYRIGGRYTYAANATGFRAAVVAVNGFQMPDTLAFGGTPTGALTQHVATHGMVFLNVGDYVEILAEQTSGAPLNTDTANSAFSSMSVEWVRT
jgi:hypothetical protein